MFGSYLKARERIFSSGQSEVLWQKSVSNSRAAKLPEVTSSMLQKVMAEKKVKRGGTYCVAGGPGKVSCTNSSNIDGVSTHLFTKNEAQRAKWVRFVRTHRPNFTASATSTLC